MVVQSDCQAFRLGLCDESAVGLGLFWFQGALPSPGLWRLIST